jgi:hypothetical protein
MLGQLPESSGEEGSIFAPVQDETYRATMASLDTGVDE